MTCSFSRREFKQQVKVNQMGGAGESICELTQARVPRLHPSECKTAQNR
jgi:hypothetical protein